MVNRVIRDDPSKSTMHNRQPITPRLLWESLKDYDMWPLYALGLVWQIPTLPPHQYLTLTLRKIGFSVIVTNLLSVPTMVLSIVTILGITYISEATNQRSYPALTMQVWSIPFLIYIYVVDITQINRWVAWVVLTLFLAFPSRKPSIPLDLWKKRKKYIPNRKLNSSLAHPILVSWNSRNSNTVRLRTVSAAVYNMSVQACGIIASNVYVESDAPRYKKGNRVLLGTAAMNIALFLLVKVYYVLRNKSRDKKWDALTEEQKREYIDTTTDEGNKRLDFRFAH